MIETNVFLSFVIEILYFTFSLCSRSDVTRTVIRESRIFRNDRNNMLETFKPGNYCFCSVSVYQMHGEWMLVRLVHPGEEAHPVLRQVPPWMGATR